MSVSPRAAAFGLALLALGAVGGYFGSRWTQRSAAPPPPPKPLAPLESMLQLPPMNFAVSENGKRQWEFHADKVNRSQNGALTTLDQLRQGVYYKDGKPYLWMKAGGLIYDQVLRKLHMKGGVEVKGLNGLQFNASSLVWNGVSKKFMCPGPVRMNTPDGWIEGAGALIGDLQKQTFSLQKVNGQFRLDSSAMKGLPL